MKDKPENKTGKAFGDRKSERRKDKKFASTKEALEGISEALIQKHRNAKASCWRCGRSNHHTLECFAKRTEDGEEILKGSSGLNVSSASTNRTRDRIEVPNPEEPKKAQTAAIVVEESRHTEEKSSNRENSRIWELDTDEEADS